MKNIILFILIVSFSNAVFSDSTKHSSPDTIQIELDKNITLWDSTKIDSYHYTYRISCFCLVTEDIVVIVEDGEIKEAFYTPSGSHLPEEDLNLLFTIEDLFAKIQGAITDDVASLYVTYNSDLGYPERIFIDVDEMIADEEITHIVVDFEYPGLNLD
jgi:hypothetical protein